MPQTLWFSLFLFRFFAPKIIFHHPLFLTSSSPRFREIVWSLPMPKIVVLWWSQFSSKIIIDFFHMRRRLVVRDNIGYLHWRYLWGGQRSDLTEVAPASGMPPQHDRRQLFPALMLPRRSSRRSHLGADVIYCLFFFLFFFLFLDLIIFWVCFYGLLVLQFQGIFGIFFFSPGHKT